MPRYAAKVDRNHAEIVRALRACGASVWDTSRCGDGAPDLVIGVHRSTVLLEVKSGNGKPNDLQQAWHARWRGGPLVTAWTVEEALAAIGVRV